MVSVFGLPPLAPNRPLPRAIFDGICDVLCTSSTPQKRAGFLPRGGGSAPPARLPIAKAKATPHAMRSNMPGIRCLVHRRIAGYGGVGGRGADLLFADTMACYYNGRALSQTRYMLWYTAPLGEGDLRILSFPGASPLTQGQGTSGLELHIHSYIIVVPPCCFGPGEFFRVGCL